MDISNIKIIFGLLCLVSVLLSACGGGGGGGTPASTYSVGGTLTGLTAGNSITLTDNGTDTLPLTANGAFAFATKLANGAGYNLTLSVTTPAQPCTSTYGASTINAANVTSLNVFCGMVGGANTFTATGSLATARAYYTATLLPSGKVLVSGGSNGGYLASAELYDPSTGNWTTTGSLNMARDYHTVTLLPSGQVLVSGGLGTAGAPLASAELYDPTTGVWTATGSLVTARTYYTATLLPSGKVLVSGGHDTAGAHLASAELYDPSTGNWTSTGSLATGRDSHTATLLPSGKVLVSGGSNGGYLASAELYF